VRRAGLVPLAALAFPATAAAQVPPAPTPPPAPPVPAPAPVAAPKLSVSAQEVFGGGKHPAAITGRSFTVRVKMTPLLPNEPVILRVYRGSKKIQVKTLHFNVKGVALLKVKSAKPGQLVIKASHKATPTAPTFRARTLRVQALRPQAGYGARGPLVRLLQSKLASMHYVVPTSGVFDAGTGRAVMAWRKVAGMARTEYASSDVFAGLLKGRGQFKVRHPGDGHHVEARLNSQVLALIIGGKVQRIYTTSSGKPSTPTVQGKFRVYMKTPGVNAKGMVDSNYFIRGYAIHGYASVPPYNASHGCLRVPVPNARSIYDWLRIGDVVWVEP
jgi:peptidoglycan hydrolase-like protein with peptidoglycan-binding domain